MSKDTIYRQDAIDALIRKMRPQDNGDGTMVVYIMSGRLVEETLNDLPSAQPEWNNHTVACMHDLISRQEAIDEIRKCRFVVDAIEKIKDLPSVQPEIVRCKECKWYGLPSHKITENCVRWMKSNGILLPIKPNDYCSYAERRTDDGD
jgi:hypothetical protein